MSLSRYAFVGIPAFIVGVIYACMVMVPPVFPVDQYGYLFRGGCALLALTGGAMVVLAFKSRQLEPTKAFTALIGALLPLFMGLSGITWSPVATDLDHQIVDLGAIATLLILSGSFLVIAGPARVPRSCVP